MSEYVLRVNDQEFRAEIKELTPDQARVAVNGEEYVVDLVEFGRRPQAVEVARPAPTAPAAPAARPARPGAASDVGNVAGAVPAPLPGLVLQLKVKEGETVSAGQVLLVMEAMKMENQITAPHNGTVKKVFVVEGDTVGEGDPLVEVGRPEMTTL
jgi:biotin carboxyl carrier protein